MCLRDPVYFTAEHSCNLYNKGNSITNIFSKQHQGNVFHNHMCILFPGFNCFSAGVIVWKTHFESISVPNCSQEIAFGGVVEEDFIRKAHAVLKTLEAYQKCIKIVKTVHVQTFKESEMWDVILISPHLAGWAVERSGEMWFGDLGMF